MWECVRYQVHAICAVYTHRISRRSFVYRQADESARGGEGSGWRVGGRSVEKRHLSFRRRKRISIMIYDIAQAPAATRLLLSLPLHVCRPITERRTDGRTTRRRRSWTWVLDEKTVGGKCLSRGARDVSPTAGAPGGALVHVRHRGGRGRGDARRTAPRRQPITTIIIIITVVVVVVVVSSSPSVVVGSLSSPLTAGWSLWSQHARRTHTRS